MRGWVEPCVESPRGNLTNHHWGIDPKWGEVILNRVMVNEATNFAIVAIPYEGEVWVDVRTPGEIGL